MIRRSWPNVVAVLATLGVAISVALPALGAEPVRLEWVRLEGASECIDATTLETRVQQRLGAQPFEPQATRSIEGVVRREGDAWRAEIAVRARADERDPPLRVLKSRAPSCASLGDAVVLAVALAIDPEAALSSPSTGSTDGRAAAAPAPNAAPTGARPAPMTPAATPPAPDRRSRGRATAGVASQFGLLPSPSLGASLFAGVELGKRFELGLDARLFPAVHGSGEPPFEVGATVGTLLACAQLARGSSVALHACGGPSVGVVQAVLLSGERSQPGQRAWLGAELGGELTLALSSSLALLFGARAALPLTRYRFTIDGSDRALFRQSVVAGLAQVGLELAFGARR